MSTRALVVHPPDEAARRLGGISVAMLIKLLKEGGYAYTSLRVGSKPWGRGRQYWGLSEDQLAAIIAGQAKRFPRPDEAGQGTPAEPKRPKVQPGLAALGWDGKSRLRVPKAKGAK